MTKLDTILFDLDGTLINTNEVIIESFASTFRTFFPEENVTRELILTFIGPTLQQTFSNYTTNQQVINAMIKHYRTFYVDYEMGNFEIYPDVLEVVTDLKQKGYNLGIVTSKFKEAAWPSFTYYGLDQVFDVFVSLDDVEKPKPDRNPVDVALSQFDSYNKVIMIGDNKSDIMSGKNAGVYGAGVAWSIKGEQYLNEVNPDYMLHSIKDIYDIIKKVEEE